MDTRTALEARISRVILANSVTSRRQHRDTPLSKSN
jgi:hypothetical protein